MYVRMAWRRLKLGAWDQFEQYYREKLIPGTRGFNGLQQRQLWRSTEDSDEGISVSLWDSLEDMERYEDSEERRGLAQEMEVYYPPLAYPRGEYWVKHFKVISRMTNP